MKNMKASLLVVMVLGCLAAGCQTYTSPAIQEQAASARSGFAGHTAPDFSLANQDDKAVTLKDLRDHWVVLYFYPKDETPGCTCEATEFTDLLGGLRKMNAIVIGVSPDSPAAHRAFIQRYHLQLTLLSDPGHEMMRQYGAWVSTYLGQQEFPRVIRSTMIIDPEGVIRYYWPEVIPKGHANRVRQTMKQLQEQQAGQDRPSHMGARASA
jgi:thioredoxin-dependent peroxiredoxin